MKLKQVLNNTFFNILISVSKAILDLLFVKYCILNLGNDQYSDWVLIISIISFVKLMDFGTNHSLIILFIKKNFKKINETITFKIIVSLVVSIIFFFLVFYFFDYFQIVHLKRGKGIMLIMLFSHLLFINIGGPLTSYLLSKEEFIKVIITSGLYVLLPLALFLIIGFKDLFFFAILNFVCLIIVLVLQYYWSNFKNYIPNFKLLFHNFFYVFNNSNKNFFLFNLVVIFYPAVEILFIKYYLGNDTLVNHVIYFKLPLLFVAFMAQLMTNYFPAVAIKTNENIEEAHTYINNLFYNLLRLCFISSLVIFCFNNLFITLWMSDQYSLGYNLLIIIQLLTFVDALIWSVQQIILPHNPKLFKIKFFIYELVFRFIIIFVLHYYSLLDYNLFILTCLISKSFLFIALFNSYNFINKKFKLYHIKYLIFCSIFLYLFTYFLFNNKILLNTIYSFILFISSITLLVINRKKIKNLF